jgi:hypothetical protein
MDTTKWCEEIASKLIKEVTITIGTETNTISNDSNASTNELNKDNTSTNNISNNNISNNDTSNNTLNNHLAKINNKLDSLIKSNNDVLGYLKFKHPYDFCANSDCLKYLTNCDFEKCNFCDDEYCLEHYKHHKYICSNCG